MTFNILEASISDHKAAIDAGHITSVDLVASYLNRIAIHDTINGLNAFTVFNPHVFKEASASDARRASGLPARPLEGIPYTLKDSYKYAQLSVTNGSPALSGLVSNEDSIIASKLRRAGAILLGKTNMPPMAAGGMQRGLYGRAESPYNSKYLTGAFSSGSSNGAATATASSMCAFGMGSETVSSGRSPASNNALVCYTPSKGFLSCKGLWPLYVTCDVPVPYARSMTDLLEVLDVIGAWEDGEDIEGDFWREQSHVEIVRPEAGVRYSVLGDESALKGKRIGVPKMYVGKKDSDPNAKHPYVSPEVVSLWERAAADLEALGAEIIYTDLPLVTNYENDTISGEANNVSGAPADWNQVERGALIAKAWEDFLQSNSDEKLKSLADIKDPIMIFPKPESYVPDTFLEVRNWIDYAGLPSLASKVKDTNIYDLPGLAQAVQALESQRKRDFDDWLTTNKLDCIVFPAQGDVGLADLEFSLDSTNHSLQNGIKYSNGNRALRHLGVPTVSVPMGVMEGKDMPVNLTFAGRAGDDGMLLSCGWAYEKGTSRRTLPGLAPGLDTDTVSGSASVLKDGPKRKMELTATVKNEEIEGEMMTLHISGALVASEGINPSVEVFIDGAKVWSSDIEGRQWEVNLKHKAQRPVVLGWDLKPLPPKPVQVIVIARAEGALTSAKLLFVDLV